MVSEGFGESLKSKPVRLTVSIVYIINEVALTIYLLFIPIQIAYFWLLVQINDGSLQNIIDSCVLSFFMLHILLYVDEKLQAWLNSPYSSLQSQFLSIELVYDSLCVGLAIYAITSTQMTQGQKFMQIFFIGKVYKLIKLDINCMHIVVGTWFYPFYKIIRTLLIFLMVISFIGSLFYGIAYYLYLQKIQFIQLLWIVDSPAINDCVSRPFLIQLQYAIYWALGTASTAAYGDISASQPSLVLLNIFALAFEGFLFGFYLNSMHSIPLERKQREAILRQQFDSFQNYAKNRNISQKLYLQIMCSLEYSGRRKRNLNQFERFLPPKYLQEVKLSVYRNMLDNPIFFNRLPLQMSLSELIQETVTEVGEDVYDYSGVLPDDLIFVKQGQIQTSLHGELGTISTDIKHAGDYFGLYQFLTSLQLPQSALCSQYCFIYRLKRQSYKKLLHQDLKLKFNFIQQKAILFEGAHLQREPIVAFIHHLSISESSIIYLFHLHQKKRIMYKLWKGSNHTRQTITRKTLKQSKLKYKMPHQYKTRKHTQCQTDEQKTQIFEEVCLWQQKWEEYSQKSRQIVNKKRDYGYKIITPKNIQF